MTSGWSAQSYQNRLKAGGMGDEAEAKFEEVWNPKWGSYVRYGFNRPPFRMTNLTSFTRHTPDYCSSDGTLWECMGLGRDGILKFKDEKYRALMDWNRVQKVGLFVWNSAEREYAFIDWTDVKILVARARKDGIRSFNDGNEYWPIQWDWVRDTRKDVD